MRAQATVLLPVLALAATACARARLPYDATGVPAGARPVHAKTLVVLPFEDRRAREDADDDSKRFVYLGVPYAPTDFDELLYAPGSEIAEAVARHLAAARLFDKVIFADRLKDAPGADLVLTGGLRRARGYVELDAAADKIQTEGRGVLAELYIEDVRVAEPDGRSVLLADTGWTIYERRPEPPELSPWLILSDALYVANEQLAGLLRNARLDGSFEVRERVGIELSETSSSSDRHFGRLADDAPYGWRFSVAPALELPPGWRGPEASCRKGELQAQQTQQFNRTLGPHVPSVALWACPADVRAEVWGKEPNPASYIGTHRTGARFFLRELGASNWPDARAQLEGYLGIRAPTKKHVFRLPD